MSETQRRKRKFRSELAAPDRSVLQAEGLPLHVIPENAPNLPSYFQTEPWPGAGHTFHNFQTALTLFSGKMASVLLT